MSALIPLAINGAIAGASIAIPLLFPQNQPQQKPAMNPNTNTKDTSFLSQSFSFKVGNSSITISTWIIIAIVAFFLLMVVL